MLLYRWRGIWLVGFDCPLRWGAVHPRAPSPGLMNSSDISLPEAPTGTSAMGGYGTSLGLMMSGNCRDTVA